MRRGDRKGSALVITMLILVIMTAAGLYAVGISLSGIESVSVAEQEQNAMNAAEAGLYYGIDKFPVLARDRGIRLPNGARYDVTVSHTGTVPAPGYDMDWAQVLFKVEAVGSSPSEERIRTTAEAEAAFGPVRAGTEPAYWGGAPYRSATLRSGTPSPFYHDFRDPSARSVFVRRHGKRKRILLMSRTLRIVDAGSWTPGNSAGEEEVGTDPEREKVAVSDIRLRASAGSGADPPDTGWRTLAVMRGGGEEGGYLAFDITDSGPGGTPVMLWEVTKRRLPILGGNPSAPAIGKVRVPMGRAVAPGATFDRWVILVGAETGILVFEASTGRILQLLSFPGMGEVVAPPAIALDGDGYIERMYAGDLSGNLWRAAVDDSGGFDLGGGPFFSVTRREIAKEIRGKCAIVPGEGTATGLWVFFGTGDIENLSENKTGGIFAVFDGIGYGEDGDEQARGTTERDLADATGFFERIDNPDTGFTIREGTTSRGWYAILPAAGEQILSGPRVFFSNLFLTTFQRGRKGSGEQGVKRVYGFGIAPEKNLGNPALSGLTGSESAKTNERNPAKRVRFAGVGGNPASLAISPEVGGIAHLSVRSSDGDRKIYQVPAPGRMKSIRSWKVSPAKTRRRD